MAWDIRRTYYYLVCFATLLMVIIGIVLATQNALDLALPTEPYRPMPAELAERGQTDGSGSPYTRAELEKMADEQARVEAQRQQRFALRRLLGNLALTFIAGPVYLYHWRRVRHLENGG